jgi:hypothetical protein
MKNNRTRFDKKRHWIDRLIVFCAFLGGFLLSASIYSEAASIKVTPLAKKADQETSELILEQALNKRDKDNQEQILESELIQRGVTVDAEAPNSGDPSSLWGVDFSPGSQPMTIKILPKEDQYHGELPLVITFLPDQHCEFGDGRACIYPLASSTGEKIILASIHSGVGGEAEAFRNMLEGTGFNRALYKLERVNKNVQSIIGSSVVLEQGSHELIGLELIAILRIPPEHLDTYMALPIEHVLDFATEITGADAGIFNQDLLIFETCGWQLPDEAPIEGHPYTSSSIYLGVIGLNGAVSQP